MVTGRGTDAAVALRRRAGIVVVVALVASGCGSSSPTAPLTTPQPTTSSSAAAAATASPSFTPTPSPTPAVWSTWAAPAGRGAQVLAVGTDGTVYVVTFPSASGPFSDLQTIALGPDGAPRTDWTAPTLGASQFIQTAAARPNGTLYLDIGTSSPNYGGTMTVLGASGAVQPGWPVDLGGCNATDKLFVDPGGTVRFVCGDVHTGKAAVEAIGADGSRATGWPVALKAWRGRVSSVAGDGTAYVTQSQQNPLGPSTSIAIGVDGNPVPGWAPMTTKTGYQALDVAISTGAVRVVYPTGSASGDTFTWLDAKGGPTGPTATGPATMTEFDVQAGAGDVVYAADYTLKADLSQSGPGAVYAYGTDGKVVSGWPAKLQGWAGGIWVGANEVWVLEFRSSTSITYDGFRLDGSPIAGTPVTASSGDITQGADWTSAAVGPDGTLYATDTTGGVTTVFAIKAGG